MKIRIFLTAVLLFLPPPPGLKAQTAHKPAEFIVRTVLAKAKENDVKKKEKLTFYRIYTVENLNDDGKVIDQEKKEKTLVNLGGTEELKEKDGRPAGRNSKVSTPKFNMIRALEAMLKFHDFDIVRIDMLKDRPYYLISFKPVNSGTRPGNDVEEVLLRSEGWMYVDIEKFYISKLTAWMTRPYSRFLVFNLRQANLEMKQKEFEEIVVMESVTIIDKYSVFGVETFEKQTYSYEDYKLAQEE